MKIYVASSWRNDYQPEVVAALREAGFDAYDFRNPRPGGHGFAWSDIDDEWQGWSVPKFSRALDHPIARAGFDTDMAALRGAAAVVLVLPCGRSAHLEAGWACGANRPVYVFSPLPCEPELMYSMCECVTDNMIEIIEALRALDERPVSEIPPAISL